MTTKFPSKTGGFVTLLMLVVLSTAQTSCFSGKEPFLSARLCFKAQSDVPHFLDILRREADIQQMKYFDRTAGKRDELRRIGDPDAYVRTDGFMMNVGILRGDGLGVTASELGGPGYQIALGFSEGKSAAEAHAFANAFISRLRERWQVDTVPKGVGVLPMTKCG